MFEKLSVTRLGWPLLFTAALAGSAVAQKGMKATAAEEMMLPAQKEKMKACEQRAAHDRIPMDQRAKFLMDCMTAKDR